MRENLNKLYFVVLTIFVIVLLIYMLKLHNRASTFDGGNSQYSGTEFYYGDEYLAPTGRYSNAVNNTSYNGATAYGDNGSIGYQGYDPYVFADAYTPTDKMNYQNLYDGTYGVYRDGDKIIGNLYGNEKMKYQPTIDESENTTAANTRPEDIYANKYSSNLYESFKDLKEPLAESSKDDYSTYLKKYDSFTLPDRDEVFSKHAYLPQNNKYINTYDINYTQFPINVKDFIPDSNKLNADVFNEYNYEIASNVYMPYYSPNMDGDYSIMKRTFDTDQKSIQAQKTVRRYGRQMIEPFVEEELAKGERREWWDGSDLY